MESKCFMTKLRLKPSSLKGPIQYAFNFSGGPPIPEEMVDIYDYTYESIFRTENNQSSFHFNNLEELLNEEEKVSPEDIIMITENISIFKGKDEHSTASLSFTGDTYHFRVGDIKRIKGILSPDYRADIPNHEVIMITSDKRVYDIGS